MNGKIDLATMMRHGVLHADSDRQLRSLYTAVAGGLDLQLADLLTIRDLLEYAAQPSRGLHALLLCLFGALTEGSVCLRTDHAALTARLRDLVGVDKAAALGHEIREALDHQHLGDLVGHAASAYTPLIQPTPDLVYFQRYFAAESRLKEQLSAMLRADQDTHPAGGSVPLAAQALRDVLDHSPCHTARGKSVQLNTGQRLAVAAALLKRLVVICGGPGTGKTSIVVALLRVLSRCGIPPERMALAAPTGRAAQRMTETIRAGLASVAPDAAARAADEPLRPLEARTIHRVLRYVPSRNTFAYNRHAPLPIDLLIVDEVSMVDVLMMSRLLEALPRAARVVLLGDRNQLPSVEAGAVLADLLPSGEPAYTAAFIHAVQELLPDTQMPPPRQTSGSLTDRVVVLTSNYRSEASLVRVAEAVNCAPHRGSAPNALEAATALVRSLPGLTATPATGGATVAWPAISGTADDGGHELDGGCRFLAMPRAQPAQLWRGVLSSWAAHHYLAPAANGMPSYRDLVTAGRSQTVHATGAAADAPELSQWLEAILAHVDRVRVLALVRAGMCGTHTANRVVSDLLQPQLDPNGRGARFAGCPVMITRNDYTHGLFNGDVGVVFADRTGAYYAAFRRADGFVTFAVDALPPNEPAFAITVHKSQGSEYDRVLLVLPDDPEHRLLTREIIYTGLTRARRLAIVCGSELAFARAIAGRIQRHSGLGVWDSAG